MKEHWKTNKLGEITTWKSGGTPSKENANFWNGSIPWISAKTFPMYKAYDSETKITEAGLNSGSRLANVNSIILLVRGSGLFKDIPLAIVTKAVAFNQDVKAIEPDLSVLDPLFLLYWLKGNKKDLNDKLEHTGIGAGKLDLNVLKNLKISFPESIKEQQSIASILSSLDDKIELNLQMNQTLESITQAIFKEWFVNFNFPDFDGELVNGLPKGWRNGRLGEILELVYGKALKADTRVNGEFPVIGSSGIVDYHNEYLVEAPGIVIGRKGTIGEVIWIDKNFFPIDTTFYVKDLLGVSDLYFHYFILREQEFKKIASDSAVPGLNRNQAMNNEIVIPEKSVINEFNIVVRSLFGRIDANKEEIKSLIQIRDSLLPKLMSGKIEVKA